MSVERPRVCLSLRSNDRREPIELSKWKSYEVESDLLTPADAFHFVAPNINGEHAGEIIPEDTVRVTVDGEVVAVGNVDDVAYEVTDEGSTLSIAGRDPGRFLADCSARVVRLQGKTLEDLARILAEEWVPIWMTNQIGSTALPRAKKFKVDPGETVLDCLNRFAAQAKVLIWIDEQGRGVIGRPNYRQAPSFALYRYLPDSPNASRNNVLTGRIALTSRESFSTVTCLSAVSNSGSGGGLFGGGGGGLFGGGHGKSKSKLRGTATDRSVRTHKPKVISGQAANTKQAQTLAEEEVQKAQFGSWRGIFTVPGHYNNGKLWSIDTLCTLTDEVSGFHGTYYVVRRRFTGDSGGARTEVELRPKGIYLVE